MLSDDTKKLFLNKYNSFGEEKFYKFLINYSINRIVEDNIHKGQSPEIELMDYYDKFLALFRKEHNRAFLEIAKLFRKAAHKTYKILLAQGKIKISDRFLNVI
jgi:hypothetical protein